jgi:hypothetical protein
MRKVNIPALFGCHNQTDPVPRFDYQLFAKKQGISLDWLFDGDSSVGPLQPSHAPVDPSRPSQPANPGRTGWLPRVSNGPRGYRSGGSLA